MGETKLSEIDGVMDHGMLNREAEGRSSVDLIDLLTVLAQRKKTILQITLSAAVVALIVVLLLPKTYTATTTILPPQQNQSSANMLLGQIGILGGLSSGDLGLKNPDDLFIAMLSSRYVQDAIIDKYDLRRVYGYQRYQDARKKLNSRSAILAEREGLISISVTDHDPRRAADIANTYVDELRLLNQSLAVSEAAQRRLFYQQKLDSERDELSKAELGLRQVQEKSGLIQPDAQGRAIVDAVETTRAQVAVKEVQLQAMRTYATANNPDLKRTEEELSGLRSQLAKMERSTSALGNGNLSIPTGRLPEVELDYIRRARDLKYHESVYEFLGKQLEAARIDEAKEAVVVQVVDKATEPEKKSGPPRTIIVVVTALLAFLLSCASILLSALLRGKERDPREHARLSTLRQALGLSARNS